MTIIGSAYVDIRAITDKLEADIKAALASLPETIEIKVEADTRPAEEQIDLLIAWGDEHNINIDVEANTTAAEVHIGEIVDEHRETIVDVDADTIAAEVHIEDFMAAASEHEINVPVDVQDVTARLSLAGLMVQWGHKVLDWWVNVNTFLAEAELGILSRPRIVEVFAKVNEGSQEHLKTFGANLGTFLSGISGATALRGLIAESIDAKIHIGELAPKIALTAEKIGTLATSAMGAVGGLLSLGSSLVDIMGIAPAIPGVFVGMAIAMKITTLAFGDMKKAVPELYNEMKTLKESMSHAFWDDATTGFQDLFQRSTVLKDSLVETSHAMGGFWGSVFSGMAQEGFAKAMQGDFANLNEGIKIMTGNTGIFLHIFQTLGEFGSAYLPKLADGLGGLATRFDAFLTHAQADGTLKAWVDNGVTALKDLGHVIGEVSGIFGGLADAANAAGGMTLGVLGGSLERLNATIRTADFQKNLVNIFQGANAAIGFIVDGLGRLMGAIGYLSPALKIVETQIGLTLFKALDIISGILARPEVAKGLTDLFGGILKGVGEFAQAMDPIGVKLGSIMSFVGEIVATLGKVVGHAAAVLIPPIATMLDTIKPLIGPLGDLVVKLTDWLAPVLKTLAQDILPPAVDMFKKILPAITNLVDAITPDVVALMDAFGASMKKGADGSQAQQDADGINNLAQSIRDGQKDFKSWTDGFKQLDDATAWLTSTKHTTEFHNSTVSMFNDFAKNNQKLSEDIRKSADDIFGPFNKAVDKMNKDVNQGLADFWADAGRNNEGMSKDFQKGWNDFWGGLDGFNKDTSKKVNDDLKNFWTDVGHNNDGMAKDFMKGWDGMWKDFAKAVKPVQDTAGKIKDNLDKLWGSLVSRPVEDFAKKWDKGWQDIKKNNENLSKDINKNISQWWSDISAGFTTNATKVSTKWDSMWKGFSKSNQSLSKDINKNISQWWGDVSAGFTTNATKVGTKWDKMWSDMKTSNSKTSADINKNVSKWWGDVSAPFVKKGAEIGKNWDKTWSDIKSSNEKLSADVNKNISSWWSDISGDFNRGVSDLNNGWNGMWNDIHATAANFIIQVTSGIQKLWADAQHAFEEGMKIVHDVQKRGWDAVFEYLNGLWNDMLNAGGHIIDGLVKGIQDGVGAVGKAIAGVGQSVLDGIAHIMEMASPSKAMRRRGQWIVEGLSDGIHAHADLAVDATHAMSKRILDAAKITIPPIKTSGVYGPTGGNSNIFASLNGDSLPTPQSYGYNSRGTGASSVIQPTVNVYPSAPLNERQVGQMAASQLFWNFTNR
jgi:hypothetical protein